MCITSSRRKMAVLLCQFPPYSIGVGFPTESWARLAARSPPVSLPSLPRNTGAIGLNSQDQIFCCSLFVYFNAVDWDLNSGPNVCSTSTSEPGLQLLHQSPGNKWVSTPFGSILLAHKANLVWLIETSSSNSNENQSLGTYILANNPGKSNIDE